MNYVNIQGEDDCWLWLGAQSGNGYGRLEFEGRYQQAHRVSYQIHCEPIPEDYNVLHTCDNRICVNPKHLFPGTQQDNVDDMVNKGRDSFGGERPKYGVEHPGTFFTEDQVREIKWMLNEGYTHKFIGEYFGVARQTITNINLGRSWSHIS